MTNPSTILLLVCFLNFGFLAHSQECVEFPPNVGVIVLPITLSGSPHKMIFDTGSSNHLLDWSVFPPNQRHNETYFTLRHSKTLNAFGEHRDPKRLAMQLAGYRVPVNKLVCVTDMEKLLGVKVPGIIGSELLNNAVVEINFDASTVTINPTTEFATEAEFHITENLGRPILMCPLVDGDREPFLVDTGFNDALTLAPRLFDQLLSSKHIVNHHSAYSVKINSQRFSDAGTLKKFEIGNFVFRDVPVLKSNRNKIGLAILQNFVTRFDLSKARIFIRRANRFSPIFDDDENGNEKKVR